MTTSKRKTAQRTHDAARNQGKDVRPRAVARTIAHELVSSRSTPALKRAVAAIGSLPVDQIQAVLIELAPRLTREMLGYVIVPLLIGLAREDGAVRDELIRLLDRDDAIPDLRLALLDSLDVFMDAGTRSSRLLRAVLHAVSVRRRGDRLVRRRAIRALRRDPSAGTTEILQRLINNGDLTAVDAAAHVVVAWTKRGGRAADLCGLVVRFARRAPAKALQCPGVLLALAGMNTRPSAAALQAVLGEARQPRDWARLIATLGTTDDASLLEVMIEGAAKAAFSPELALCLHSLLRRRTEVLRRLDKAGLIEAFVFGAAAVPHRATTATMGRLVELSNELGRPVALKATRALERIERANASRFTPPPKLPPEGPRTARVRGMVARALSSAAATTSLVQGGFWNYMDKGDALYRDISNGISDNHWHGAIYLGFGATDSGYACLSLIEAAQWSDAIQFTTETRQFYPETDVAKRLEEMRDELIVRFLPPGDDFQGPRHPSGMTSDLRHRIADMAVGLFEHGIDWTFKDMLDYRGDGWNGSINDIEELRCDGVVEYAYEACGKRVCGGKKKSRWNISNSGKRHPTNHNDLHTWSYNSGELCPKIQAGNEASDSSFKQFASISAPMQVEFSVANVVVDTTWPDGPSHNIVFLSLRVDSTRYESAFVRLTVRRRGSSWHTLRSTAYTGFSSTFSADFTFEELATNVGHTTSWWGLVDENSTLRGSDGTFDFRIVAIDHGGSVSNLYQASVDIDWEEILHP
jgi:hypothetical protein